VVGVVVVVVGCVVVVVGCVVVVGSVAVVCFVVVVEVPLQLGHSARTGSMHSNLIGLNSRPEGQERVFP
jgi:hypothetical protein